MTPNYNIRQLSDVINNPTSVFLLEVAHMHDEHVTDLPILLERNPELVCLICVHLIV